MHLFSFIKKKQTNNKKNGIKGGGEERGGIRLQFFRFFGGWVWSGRKKKGTHGWIVSDCHGHPLELIKNKKLNVKKNTKNLERYEIFLMKIDLILSHLLSNLHKVNILYDI